VRFGDFLRVELDQLVCIFDVDEDAALAIGLGKFGFTAERKGASYGAVGSR